MKHQNRPFVHVRKVKSVSSKKVGDEEKKCLCPTHYTDTSRYFVCGFYDDYLRLISLQLSKGRHFFKATTAERNRKKKKIKKDAV